MTEQAVTTRDQRLPAPAPGSVRDLLQSAAVRARFERVLGDPNKAALFVGSLSTLVYANHNLRECDPNTIIAAAVKAAAFDVSIDPALGFAYIIPYKGQATFQPGWKLFVQLAHRTGQYTRLHVTEVYAGEVRGENRLTGDLVWGERTGDQIIGYAAYLRLTNGFEKSLFWPSEKITAHAVRYAPGYGRSDSKWKTDFDSMARKTVLKQLLSKWGPLSIEMRQAFEADTPPPGPVADTSGTGEPAEPPAIDSERAKALLYGDDDAGAPASSVTPEPEPPPSNSELDQLALAAEAQPARRARR